MSLSLCLLVAYGYIALEAWTSFTDVVVASVSYFDGMVTGTVLNQDNTPTPAGVTIAVGYSVGDYYKTRRGTGGSLVAGGSAISGSDGARYIKPGGKHTVTKHADDVDRSGELDENKKQRSITVGTESGPIVAFPGAVGFGANTVGGRGGNVVYVTNLQDRGPGSLRAALERSGKRTVIFRISGTITLKSPISVTNPYLTVAGQTAPGGGIALKHNGVQEGYPRSLIEIRTHDVIVRHLRLRRGLGSDFECCGDNLELSNASNVIVDHVSMSWATDESMSAWPAHNVTLQWCIIAESLRFSTHSAFMKNGKSNSFGALYGGGASNNITTYRNLFISNVGRNPSMAPWEGGKFQLVNNLVHNVCQAIQYDQVGPVLTQLDAIGNMITLGPDSCDDSRQNIFFTRNQKPQFGLFGDGPRSVYVEGNITPNRRAGMDEWLATTDGNMGPIPAPLSERSFRPHSGMPGLPIVSAAQAKTLILANAGATLPCRDSVDQRLVNEANTGGGQIIDDPAEVGGWPTLAIGTPYPDNDRDGMDDGWEKSHGFSPSNPNDRNGDKDGDGYTNLEEFLNNTAP